MRTNRHHRRPRSQKGSGAPRNISRVSVLKHIAWHDLFGNMTAEEIVEEINRVWLDPDFFMVLVPKDAPTYEACKSFMKMMERK